MRFHEIEMHNVRGIDSLAVRDIADRGVIVISGENESGKTTIADALEVALTVKWKSRAAEALSLYSHNTQDKPRIKVRMELDGYEFTLDKTFGTTKDAGTTITVHAPHPEMLKDEAAEKWLEQRRDSADTENLWQVFVAEQGQAQKTLSLGGFTQVTNALQTATGQRAETAAESGIFDAVKQIFHEFYTKAGKPKKALTDVEEALSEARRVRDEAAEKVREFDALNEEANNNEENQKAQRELLPTAVAEVARWAEAAEELQKFRVAVDAARQKSESAQQRYDSAVKTQKDRETLIGELDKASASVQSVQQAASELEKSYLSEKNNIDKAQAKRDAAVKEYRAARKAEDTAAVEVQLAELRDTKQKLSARVEKIESLREKLAEHRAAIAKNPVEDSALEEVQKAAGILRTAMAVLQAASPVAKVTAKAAAELTVDGEKVTISPESEAVTRYITSPVAFAVGDIDIEVSPGTGAEKSQREVHRAEEKLRDLLENLGVDSPEEAQQSNTRRRQAELEAERLEVSLAEASENRDFLSVQEDLDSVTSGVDIAAERYQELSGEPAPEEISIDSAKAKLEDLAKTRRQAEEKREQADGVLSVLARRPAQEKYMEAVSYLESARSVEKVRADALSGAREKASDAEVYATVENRKKELENELASFAEAQAELSKRDAEDVADSLEGARGRVERSEARLAALEKRRNEIRVHLDYFDSANEKLAAAEGAVERAQRQWASVSRRALAAKTLYETLVKARKESRAAIAAPLLKKLDEYGGNVFGPDTTFEMSESLEISSRSNAQGSFAVSDLSGGAQEQLDILLRLAVAGVMEGGQGAPVIIDDALGYSDENRLRRMNNAIARAGRDMQVIVLTCDENRFDRVKDARLLKIVDLAIR